jgi:two-component system response regulator FixJ
MAPSVSSRRFALQEFEFQLWKLRGLIGLFRCEVFVPYSTGRRADWGTLGGFFGQGAITQKLAAATNDAGLPSTASGGVGMNVYILDDDPDIVFTLTAMTEALGHDVTAFTSPEAFLDKAVDLEIGCIVLDYSMPQMNGLEVQARLTELKSGHSVLLLTGVGDIPEAMAAMRAGAVDCLRKPPTLSTLSAALDRAGENLAKTRQSLSFKRLTDREREVLAAIGKGKSSKVIAHELGISVRTVEAHRGAVLRKLGAATTGGAVMLAQQHGLL